VNEQLRARHLLSCLLLLVLVALAAAPLAAPAQAAAGAPAVREGFDLLMDRYVRPVGSAALLDAAWIGVSKAAGVSDAAPLALSGDRESDWQTFSAAYQDLAARPGADEAALTQAALQAMAASVQEGHTYYLSPQRYQEYQAWLRGDVRYSGIGIRIDSASLVVLEVFEGSPSDRAGLRAGDTIVAVDGEQVSSEGRDRVISRLRGPSGSPVSVTVVRIGTPEPLELVMTRDTVQIAFVTSRMLGDGVGYLRLRGFADMAVADQFVAALDGLQRQGATALVLDLRGNSGGRLDVGSRLLSLFIPSGALYHQVGRSGSPLATSAQGGYRSPPLPLTVLVDGGTASMGEIFAAAIQDYRRGQVLGTTTSGSVAAAQVFKLQDGSGLQVTVMEITSASGRVLNGSGVVPDRLVEMDIDALRAGHDIPLETAVGALRAAPTGQLPRLPNSGARLDRLAA
jgi:carboxyl-terminal processing protease